MAARALSARPAAMNRREFIERLFKTSLTAGMAGGTLGLAGIYSCTINRQDVVMSGLAPAFEGFRIALLSDIHHSPWIPASYIREVVDLTNSLRPNLIALTGDFVDNGKEWVSGCMRELSRLRAPSGVFAVLGNHDHHQRSAPVVRQGLHQAGIGDLTNVGHSLHRGGESLRIGGTGDYWREKQILDHVVAGVRKPQSIVLLQHNPDYVEKITDDRIGLVLSGHTHGGQCSLPIVGPPILPSRYGQKYAAGLCQGPQTQVFVTRGVGTTFPPIRYGCPPEVALLTLCRPQTTA